ncbi:MAG: BolA family transcriptional regulator [Paracoccaceae bacterium]|nr:BolA family transcriptional regulator [Paracoccaceae bacterium]MDE2915277.1 BolA family transcriptional regulator [Paracoccaceae bacterium]
MSRASRITTILRDAFAPDVLEVLDDSERHRGHSGYREGGETHYRVRIRAAVFDGVGRIECQRRIHKALAGEFASGLHALSLDAGGSGRPVGR